MFYFYGTAAIRFRTCLICCLLHCIKSIKSLTQHMHHKHFRVWKRQKRVLTPCRTSDAQQCLASDGLLASATLSSAVSSSPAAPLLLFHFCSSAFQVFASVKKLLILPACCPHCGLKDPVFFCYLDIWLKCNFNRFPIMSAGNRLNLPVVSYPASSGSFSYSFGIM